MKKICLFFFMIFLSASLCMADTSMDEKTDEEKTNEANSPWTFWLVSDFAYHVKSAYETGDSHFSAVESPYRSVKARMRFEAEYSIPMLQKDNPLMEDNHLELKGSLEITPVSMLPQFSVTFCPAAMFEISAGIKTGTGWNLGSSTSGIAEYNFQSQKYEKLTPFASWYISPWASALLQFDLAALWPGEWHHVVAQAEYTVRYDKMTGTSSPIWSWRTNPAMADGWMYNQFYIIGYQMPLVLSLVGVTAELEGHYNGRDYGPIADSYDGTFMSAVISPFLIFSITKNDEIYFVGNISARRSFAQSHKEEEEEPLLTKTGREWYLDFFAVRWVHRF